MDAAAYTKMSAAIDPTIADVAALAASTADRSGLTIRTDSANECPDCSHALTRATRAGVTLDVCKDHGVWFDRGELQRVAERVRGEAGKRETSRPPSPAPAADQPKPDLRKTVSTSAAFEGALNLITLFF